MLHLRPETPADLAAIHAIHQRAFGRDAEADLVDALRASDAFLPSLSLLAEEDGPPVGHLLLSRVTIVDAGRQTAALSLAPMGVVPEAQRRGVGSALVRESLRRAAAEGHRLVVVLGHPQDSPRFGFVPAGARGLTCPWPAPPEAFLVRGLTPDALSGMRGRVVYPAPFHALE